MTATAFGQLVVGNQGGPIAINDNSSATPYPSTTTLVTTLGPNFGVLEKVSVTLNGVTHGYPDDIDMILEGPDGTKTMLMSDAGGQFDLVNTTFTIDSGAASALPNESQIVGGSTYKPANYDGGTGDTDQFAAPGSGATTSFTAGSYSGLGADLSVFTGKTGNAVDGIWNLYVMDDTVVDAGSISSWTLNVFLSPVVAVSATPVQMTENTPTTVNFAVNDADTPLPSVSLTATSSDTSIIPNNGLTFGGNTGGTNRTLTISPAANAFTTGNQTVTITITAKDDQNQTYPGVNVQTITVTVAHQNQAPVMIVNGSTNISIPQGGISAPLSIQVTDVDNLSGSDAHDTVLTATSSNPNVIPATNVLFRTITSNPAGTNRVVQVAAGAATGSSIITIIATDPQGGKATATLSVTVTSVGTIVAANTNAIVVPDFGAASTYPSLITIPSNAGLGLVGKAVVSLINLEHPIPSELGVLLVAPNGRAVSLMRSVGDAVPVGIGDGNDVRLTFDPDAAGLVPAGGLTTSTNLPNDQGVGDFPAPAPAGTAGVYSTDLTSLQSSPVAGVWKLYVYDTTIDSTASQVAGGWVLQIFPAPIITGLSDQTTPEDTAKTVSFSVSDFDGTVTNIVAQVVNPGDAANVTLSTTLSGATGKVTVTPTLNFNTLAGGPVPIRVIAQDNTGAYRATNTFNLTVTPVNDAPTQSVIPKQITRAGQTVGPITFTVGDVETPAANLIVTATSNNPKLLPAGAIIVGGSGANRTIQLFPAGAQGGTADVLVTVTDTGDGVNPAASSTQQFNLTVNEAASPLFENTSGIQVLDPVSPATAAAASPYPSIITVNGLQGTVAEVQVTLYGITHPQPDDLDVMLVGPGGSPAVIIMSDAGDAGALNNVTLRFRQSATGLLPDEGQIVSGDYLPSNYGFNDFPAFGAPQDTSPTLDAFKGKNPNGDWKLYVVDDTVGPRGGVISSWQLSIRTAPTLATIGTQTTPENQALRFTVSAGDNQPGVPLTAVATVATTANTPSVIVQSITDSLGDNILNTPHTVPGGNQTLIITPVADTFGTNSITLTFTDPDNNTTSQTFQFVVSHVNQAPRFGPVSDFVTTAGTPIGFSVNVTDVEGTPVTLTATSSDQTVVSDANISITPATSTSAARTVVVTPNGVGTGSAIITLTATDTEGGKSTKTFGFTVLQSLAFANTNPITINDNSTASPYPSVISVSGINGNVSGATVSLVGFSHVFPDDVDVLLVSPDGRAVMLMSDAGGSNPASNLRLTFSDAAQDFLPDQGPLVTDIYRPGNFLQAGELGEMPPPAPAAPNGGYSTTLGSLSGVNPNGDWKLFVRDDTFPDGGQISGGWILQLQTAPTIAQVGTQFGQEDTPLPIRFTVSDQDSPASQLSITTTITGSNPNFFSTGNGFNDPGLLTGPGASVTLVTNSSNFPNVSYTLTVLAATNQPATKATATNSITITATDLQGNSTATTFLVVISAVNDSPIVLAR